MANLLNRYQFHVEETYFVLETVRGLVFVLRRTLCSSLLSSSVRMFKW